MENGQEVSQAGNVAAKGNAGWLQRVDRKLDMLGRSLT